jgi:hypothetical protein
MGYLKSSEVGSGSLKDWVSWFPQKVSYLKSTGVGYLKSTEFSWVTFQMFARVGNLKTTGLSYRRLLQWDFKSIGVGYLKSTGVGYLRAKVYGCELLEG